MKGLRLKYSDYNSKLKIVGIIDQVEYTTSFLSLLQYKNIFQIHRNNLFLLNHLCYLKAQQVVLT